MIALIFLRAVFIQFLILPIKSKHLRIFSVGIQIQCQFLNRKRKGLTQEQVAEQIGISRQHMGAIEAPNMVRAISLDVLFNIATVLEIEPYMLLKFSPDK